MVQACRFQSFFSRNLARFLARICHHLARTFSLFQSFLARTFQPFMHSFSHFGVYLVTVQRFSHFFDDLITFLKNQSLLYQFSNFQPIFCINSHSHEIFPLCQGMFTIQLPVCVCVYRTLFSSCKIPIFSLKMVISPIFGDQGPFCPFQAVLGSILAYFLA